MPTPYRSARLLTPLLPLVLSACGGGGDGGDAGSPPMVNQMTVNATRYGQLATVSLSGSHLNAGYTLSSNACKGFTRTSNDPSGSTATYTCKVGGALTGSIVALRNADGSSLANTPFTVPAPEVTLAISNGLGLSGNLVIALSPDKAPITVDNFLDYVNSGFYTGTIFHRVAPGFVVQGGGYTTSGAPKATRPPIPLESNVGLHNVQWSLGMARQGLPDTATSQFYVNLVDNSAKLDFQSVGNPGYAVFGRISAGTDVVQGIVEAPCVATELGECQPDPNVVITGAIQTQ